MSLPYNGFVFVIILAFFATDIVVFTMSVAFLSAATIVFIMAPIVFE